MFKSQSLMLLRGKSQIRSTKGHSHAVANLKSRAPNCICLSISKATHQCESPMVSSDSGPASRRSTLVKPWLLCSKSQIRSTKFHPCKTDLAVLGTGLAALGWGTPHLPNGSNQTAFEFWNLLIEIYKAPARMRRGFVVTDPDLAPLGTGLAALGWGFPTFAERLKSNCSH